MGVARPWRGRSFAVLTIVGCLFGALPGAYACGQDKDKSTDICAPDSPWGAANRLRLRLDADGEYSQMNFAISDPNDMSVETRASDKGQTVTIKVMLVGGKVLLINGYEPPAGAAIDTLDSAVLTAQLLFGLLSQAVPEGPDKFAGTKTVDIHEMARAIRTATPSANGYFKAPWTLKGMVERKNAQAVAYTLTFSNKPGMAFVLQGEWEKDKIPPALDPKTSLEGWKIYGLGVGTGGAGKAGAVDYNASSGQKHYAMLGELQKSLNNP